MFQPFQLLRSGHFLRFIQVGDAYIAGMAEPYLTDQHSAVRVVEFGLAMIKALERFTDEDGVHSSLDTYFTYTCYSIYRYIYIFILIIILVILFPSDRELAKIWNGLSTWRGHSKMV